MGKSRRCCLSFEPFPGTQSSAPVQWKESLLSQSSWLLFLIHKCRPEVRSSWYWWGSRRRPPSKEARLPDRWQLLASRRREDSLSKTGSRQREWEIERNSGIKRRSAEEWLPSFELSVRTWSSEWWKEDRKEWRLRPWLSQWKRGLFHNRRRSKSLLETGYPSTSEGESWASQTKEPEGRQFLQLEDSPQSVRNLCLLRFTEMCSATWLSQPIVPRGS